MPEFLPKLPPMSSSKVQLKPSILADKVSDMPYRLKIQNQFFILYFLVGHQWSIAGLGWVSYSEPVTRRTRWIIWVATNDSNSNEHFRLSLKLFNFVLFREPKNLFYWMTVKWAERLVYKHNEWSHNQWRIMFLF